MGSVNWTVLDLQGRVVGNGNAHPPFAVELETVAAGVHLLRLEQDHQSEVLRFVKNP